MRPDGRKPRVLRRDAPNTRGRAKALAGACCATVLAVLAATGCGSSAGKTGAATPVSGGTATYALPAGNTPNYIFPFSAPTYFTAANTNYLQYLLYRPLYWFGNGTQPTLNPQLSLGYPPRYRGHQVTIQLKNYKWSNGERVTAADVLFWIHMMQAVAAKGDWGGYVPGEFPANVTSVRAVSPAEITMQVKGPFSQRWFTYNELSQITPMPLAWDRTQAGRSNCAAVVADCAAVYRYLDAQSRNGMQSYPSSPLWTIVDGPWRLTGVDGQGDLTFRFNPAYSGPVAAHHISVLKELAFTSDQSEYNTLQAGGGQKIDVGYLPTVDAPFPPAGAQVGQNPVRGYRLTPLYAWEFYYFPYNFANPSVQGQIINQLYFREAVQSLINQAGIVNGPLHGYGHVSSTVVGPYPVTDYLSATARRGDPFPYDPVKAGQLLQSHGWKIGPGGIRYCARPGPGPADCGGRIPAGTKLALSLAYASGNAWLESAIKQFQSNAAQVGISIKLSTGTFNSLVGEAFTTNSWQMLDWGSGWTYAPDYYPTGEDIFGTGASGNAGRYSNPANDRLIKLTLESSNLKYMWRWEDYLTKQLPVVLMPAVPASLIEAIDSIRIGPQSPTLTVTPEFWYFVK
jgi:peptide/nickel transport system substrate-binding protein